ncbi:hypothetical protein SE17_31985, partial [Kouleothrix aurantiaca]
MVALLGLLTLVRNFPLPGTVFVSGLPSPTTALNTIFVGLALLLMATQLRTAVGFAQWLAIMSFLLAIQALIGSMLDADVLNTVIGAANMGPITILLFVLVSAGALLVEPAGTFIMAWRRTTAGALFRRLTIGVAALLVIGPVVWLLILRTTLFGPGIVLVLFVATTLSLLGWLAEWLDRAERGRALAEQAQRANAARLATLASASQTFAAAENDYQGLLNHITRTIAAELGDGCSILQISADGQRLEPSTRYDRDPALQSLLPTLGGGVALDADSANPSVQVFRSGRALLVPVIDIAQIQATLPPSYNAIFERIRPRSLIVVPLRVRGSTVGVLNVYRYTPEAPSFDEGDMLLAQELAARAALAIENAQLFSNEQQQRQLAELIAARLERLHAVSAALSGARSVAEVASVIMTQGVDALGA